MIVDLGRFKKFTELVGVGALGNFEAKGKDGYLTASVANSENSVMIRVNLPVQTDENEEIEIYANAELLVKRYLDVFNSKTQVTVSTNEDTIALRDENLTLYCPQIEPEIAKRNTKKIKREPEFKVKVTFPAKDIHKIYKAMDKLEESEVFFEISDKTFDILVSTAKAVLTSKEAEVENPEGLKLKKVFRKRVIEQSILKAEKTVTLEFPKEVTHPVRFTFETDKIEVSGFMMPILVTEDEDE